MRERYLYPEGKKLGKKKSTLSTLILLTYLQRKTPIILSALINILDVSRLEMKILLLAVYTKRGKGQIVGAV